MPNRSLPKRVVLKIRRLCKETQSPTAVARILRLDYKTVFKYGSSELLPRRKIDHSLVIKFYKATGRTKDVAQILKCSGTTVWRILKHHGVSIGGKSNWRTLYKTLRARITRSDWRMLILARDNFSCTVCGRASLTVHHLTPFADIRNEIFRMHPDLDPINSFSDLRIFSDLFLDAHKNQNGITVCYDCHDSIHLA